MNDIRITPAGQAAVLAVILAAIVAAILAQLPEIQRYLKIRGMD
jgi:hypothetical protein